MEHRVEPIRTYLIVWALLIVLTFATWGIAFLDLKVFNFVIAILIAGFKMLVVAYFFMHVKFDDTLTRLFAVAGLFWVALMIVLTLGDYVSRGWLPLSHLWQSR